MFNIHSIISLFLSLILVYACLKITQKIIKFILFCIIIFLLFNSLHVII